ncbi:MAG: FGGY family carbohydrate kinase [Thiotrichaceae bacterium]
MNYYLAIDQGTHASRAILYNETGQLISSQVEPVSLSRLENGHIEQNALEIVHSVKKALKTLLKGLETDIQKNIKACGIACQRSTVVACNPQGLPLSPAISWQDVRGDSYLNPLPLTAERVQQTSGLPLSPHYAASKCRWLLDHHPQVKKTPIDHLYLAPLSSFLLLHLVQSSPFVIDHSHAQRMQLMDIKTLDWSDELIHAFGIPRRCLPVCKPMCDDYGLLLDTKIPITAMCGDQNAALFGSGGLTHETALINLGSGAFVLRKLTTFKKSKRLLSGIAYSTPKSSTTEYLREGTINGCGNALSWYQQQLDTEGSADVNNWRDQLPLWLTEIDNPPLFINSVGGLGSPWWSNQIEPHFIPQQDINESISENISAKSVAIIESIVFLIQDNLNLMTQEHPITLLKLSGGLSQLDGLCQKMANLSQIPVQRLVDKETTARGVAWLASGKNTAWPIADDGCLESIFEPTFEPIKDMGLDNRYQQFQHQLSRLLELAAP